MTPTRTVWPNEWHENTSLNRPDDNRDCLVWVDQYSRFHGRDFMLGKSDQKASGNVLISIF